MPFSEEQRKEIEQMMKKQQEQFLANKGKNKGPVHIPIANRAPYDPERGRLSKADAIIKDNLRKEREMKLREIEAEIKAQQNAKPQAPKVEVPVVDTKAEAKEPAVKKPGRPKKIA